LRVLGSSSGRLDVYREVAARLGTLLAMRKIGLVYGGAGVGLMGAVADAVLAAGGEVIGVIPRALVEQEIAHTGLKDLRIVGTMHERKALMAQLSDAFIALPGGIGTLEEIFEAWTWTQLGSHAKPCAILNVLGFYDKLLDFLDQVVDEAFLKPVHRQVLLTSDEPAHLLELLSVYRVSNETKWIARIEGEGSPSHGFPRF
jgi:uncharacterized protein (TIGR00730 family)